MTFIADRVVSLHETKVFPGFFVTQYIVLNWDLGLNVVYNLSVDCALLYL